MLYLLVLVCSNILLFNGQKQSQVCICYSANNADASKTTGQLPDYQLITLWELVFIWVERRIIGIIRFCRVHSFTVNKPLLIMNVIYHFQFPLPVGKYPGLRLYDARIYFSYFTSNSLFLVDSCITSATATIRL